MSFMDLTHFSPSLPLLPPFKLLHVQASELSALPPSRDWDMLPLFKQFLPPPKIAFKGSPLTVPENKYQNF